MVSLSELCHSGGKLMIDYSILEDPNRDLWDSFLANNSIGNLWQTIDYGELHKRLYTHARTPRLIAMRDGVTEGIAQGIFSKFLGLGTVMTIREGPILSMTSKDRLGLLKSIIPALENIGVRNRVMRIKIMWPYNWGQADFFRNMGYEHYGTNIMYTVDLSKGAEDLWRNIYGNKRRNIKKALDGGVEFIETSNFEDIKKFYDLLLEVAKRDNFVPGPLLWFQTFWKSQSRKDSTKLFFARWKGNNVSSVFAAIHAKTIYALGFGYLNMALDVRPNDLLHWKIMEWGCKQGFLRYHMGEVHPEEDPSTNGIWRWKENGTEIKTLFAFLENQFQNMVLSNVFMTDSRDRNQMPNEEVNKSVRSVEVAFLKFLFQDIINKFQRFC
jgi:hypothetical protein